MNSNGGAAGSLELVQMSVKNESTQAFGVLDPVRGSLRRLALRELEDLQNASFVRFKDDAYFLLGGTLHGQFSDKAYLLDLKTEKLARLPPFPAKASHVRLFPFDGKIYCFGGRTASQTPLPPYAFDLRQQTFEPLQLLPYAYKEILAVFGYSRLICLVLNQGRIVCFEPLTGEWSFWKKISYKFDFLFAHGEALYLGDSAAKTVCQYDVARDTILIRTMFDVKANEVLYSAVAAKLYVLQHVEGEPYYWEVDVPGFGFKRVEAEGYTALFGNGVLFRGGTVFTVYPDATPDRALPPPRADQSLNIFGCFEVPFEVEADVGSGRFDVRPVSSRLALKNSQAMLRLSPTDFMFAGGKRSDFSELGDVQVQRYAPRDRRVTDLRELPLETDTGKLLRLRDHVYYLNESIHFFRYDLERNLWLKLPPSTDDGFYNAVVYRDRLLNFMTKLRPGRQPSFVVEEYRPATNNWVPFAVDDVDFRVQTNFSYKVSESVFLMICSDAKAPPTGRVPVLYEVTLEDGPESSLKVRVTRLVQLSDKVAINPEVVPLAHDGKLLFMLMDRDRNVSRVVYDVAARQLGTCPPLEAFFDRYMAYLASLRLDFEHFKNFKTAPPGP